MKKLWFIFVMVLLVLPLSACKSKSVIAVQGINFLQEEVYLATGETFELESKIFPTNATNQKIEYSSSNESVVTVDQNGKVSMLGNQSAVVTVRTIDGQKVSTCIIKPKIAPTSLSFGSENFETKSVNLEDEQIIEISVGQEKQLSFNYEPSNATLIGMQLISEDSTILSVTSQEDFIVRGLKEGTTTLKAKLVIGNVTKEVVSVVRVWKNATAFSIESSEDAGANFSSIITEANNEITESEVSLSLGQEGFILRLGLFSLDGTNIEQSKISCYSTNEDVFSVSKNLSDTLDGYGERRNYTNSLNITTKGDGEAYLFVVSDAENSHGKNLVAKIKVFVNAEITSTKVFSSLQRKTTINTNTATEYDIDLALMNETFSISSNLFGSVEVGGVNENRELSNSIRKTYYFVDGTTQGIALLNATHCSSGWVYSIYNSISTTAVGDLEKTIYVLTAKRSDSTMLSDYDGDVITDANGNDITNEYVISTYQFVCRPKLEGLNVSYKGEFLESGDQIVCYKNDLSSISNNSAKALVDINSLLKFECVFIGDQSVSAVDVKVQSSNNMVANYEDGAFTIDGVGESILIFTATDNKVSFECEINLIVYDSLAVVDTNEISLSDFGDKIRFSTDFITDNEEDNIFIDGKSLMVYIFIGDSTDTFVQATLTDINGNRCVELEHSVDYYTSITIYIVIPETGTISRTVITRGPPT